MPSIILEIGEQEFTFNVESAHVNRYLNDVTPNDKIAPGYALLKDTVDDTQRAEFLGLVTHKGQVNGLLTSQMVGAILKEFGGEAEIRVKKPKPAPNS